ncbi:MAG: phosphopantetheine adenylyltransferase [Burkholderiales bacterium PBB1]|nr:MAG: phosphopantetheine adenylyltransferase [Burkholderiales bacterium PBB1]
MKVNYDGHTHEHEFEPEYGLPEPLPAGERVLWQGSPDWRVLARHVFHVRTLALYFAAILIIRGAFVLSDGGTTAAAIKAVAMTLPLVLMALGIALGLAVLCARTTVYTITDKRVTMRVGIVLNLTFNLPFARIAAAGFRKIGKDAGDIPLTLAGTDQIAFLHLWPHARPWRIAKAEPMLRCVPHGQEVARILGQAWSQSRGLEVAAIAQSEPEAPRRRRYTAGGEPHLTQGA